jgi:hypothetical protein
MCLYIERQISNHRAIRIEIEIEIVVFIMMLGVQDRFSFEFIRREMRNILTVDPKPPKGGMHNLTDT